MPFIVAGLLGALAAGIYRVLVRSPRRSPEDQAALDQAVGAIDRELAANLELTAMFDQTRQAFVLENGQFGLIGEELARELPALHAELRVLYERIPEAETAMERRGPAGSIADRDRMVVESWEGDARDLQRRLRDAARGGGRSKGARLLGLLPWPSRTAAKR